MPELYSTTQLRRIVHRARRMEISALLRKHRAIQQFVDSANMDDHHAANIARARWLIVNRRMHAIERHAYGISGI